MSNSIRDQLLGLGFKPAPTPDKKPEKLAAGGSGRQEPAERHAKVRDGKPRQPRAPQPRGTQRANECPGPRRAKSREDIDLAKAYALRAQREKDERIEAERQKQEAARLRREARARLATLVEGKALNAADADIARHFPYGGKIKRIHVTAEQLRALNAGELGVLQLDGRYLLVAAELLAQAEAIFPAAVALRVDPDAPAADDPYADPKYQVPDDLVW